MVPTGEDLDATFRALVCTCMSPTPIWVTSCRAEREARDPFHRSGTPVLRPLSPSPPLPQPAPKGRRVAVAEKKRKKKKKKNERKKKKLTWESHPAGILVPTGGLCALSCDPPSLPSLVVPGRIDAAKPERGWRRIQLGRASISTWAWSWSHRRKGLALDGWMVWLARWRVAGCRMADGGWWMRL
ncbi:hypothetical protein IE53DRAFT_254692 [Violaceomyces palustris]|uniref:Uncharacterized protein n=1 Tax=Violaceomyces palustris TaxID=1673888 RepID=A0ACD0NNJ6_9BASI|nr:hypothetical protein IE53DRAFT_254692 [Violaceomyces palustris]